MPTEKYEMMVCPSCGDKVEWTTAGNGNVMCGDCEFEMPAEAYDNLFILRRERDYLKVLLKRERLQKGT